MSQPHPSHLPHRCRYRCAFRPLAVSIALLFGGMRMACAQLLADPGAQHQRRPVIDQAANGRPLVQIAPPNGAGVSHNQYQQFNVDRQGLILNNASEAVQTQLGGWIAANPRLADGGARLILNEVTSTHRSVLRGFMEVAGLRADVVLSNPNGIVVNGAGFINAHRGVLSTGVPVLGADGALAGLRTTRGAIQVGPEDFNDRQTAQVDLIARSVQVNGQLHADRLNLVTGANLVNYANLGVQVIAGDGPAPAVAIDVSALGGMFASAIRLVGTEHGVGVRNYGQMAATAGALGIDSQGKLTLAGMSRASGALVIKAGDDIDIGQSGTLHAEQHLHLDSAGKLRNHGDISAEGDVTFKADAIDNLGAVQAGQHLHVDGASTLHNSGDITAQGDITAKADAIDNLGAMQARQQLHLGGASTLRNSGDITAQGDITAKADAIDNLGTMQAGRNLHLDSASTLRNSGDITAQGDITAKAGAIDNDGGLLGSGRHITLQASSLRGNGRTIAAGDLGIALQGDHTHGPATVLSAGGDLNFSTTGVLHNHGELAAGRNTRVGARDIFNHAGGLFNSNGLTALRAEGALVNKARIYGDDVALSADNITNEDGAVVAARNTVNIGTRSLLNREHALIRSEGDMAIGAHLGTSNKARGKAARVSNSSAIIDSGGNLDIATEALDNSNAHFASAFGQDHSQTRTVVEYELDGEVYTPAQANIYRDDGLQKMHVNGRAPANDWIRREYVETVYQTVVTASDPARITARGDMRLSGQVTNDKSVIVAGGSLSGQTGDIRNIDAEGQRIVQRRGTSTYHSTDRKRGGSRYDTWRHAPLHYDLPTEHFDLNLWQAQGNAGTVASLPVIIDIPPRQGLLGLLPPRADKPSEKPAEKQAEKLPETLEQKLRKSQLYQSAAAPDSPYQIETDPAFTNRRNFLNSDYQLRRMGVDPQVAHKRLGDGYYEQQLVKDQLLQLTGKTRQAHASNEAGYQALMDAGVALARQFQITPGMALSAAQMAALTTDIVWLVEQQVIQPDGSQQTVLAPQVYLARLRPHDLQPNGALIAADDIALAVDGSVDNSGRIQAGKQLVLQASGDIGNTLGHLRSDADDGSTTLIAGRDISSRSGSISGQRVALVAGRDIVVSTETRTSTSGHGTQIGLDRIGSIEAGTLQAEARRDIKLRAASIASRGDAALKAARDIVLDAALTQDQLNVTYDSENHLRKRQEQVHGSVLGIGGDATLIAGQDIDASAAQVNSGQALNVQAGRDVRIGAADQASEFDQASSSEDSGWLSSTESLRHDQRAATQAVGSTFSGDSLDVQAGHDIKLAGSNLVARNQVSIGAGHNIDISSTHDREHSQLQETEIRSGLFTSGKRLHLGEEVTDTDTVQSSVTHHASTIGSLDGSVSIQAGGDARLSGTQLQAQGDIDVSARNVDIAATVDTLDVERVKTTTTSGLRIGARSNITDAAMAVRQSMIRGQEVNDPRLKALYAAKAAYAAHDLAQLAKAAQSSQGASASGKVSIGLGVTVEQRTSTSHVDSVNMARAAAGGDVNITARGDATPDQGDINLTATALEADNISLDARRDLNTRSQAATASSSDTYQKIDLEVGLYAGGSAGNGGAKGGLGVYGSAEYQQSKTDISSTTHTETTLDAAQRISVKTGRDASLSGTVASGDEVKADIGRNLTLSSEQDTERFDQRQLGGQIEGRYAFGNDSGVSGNLHYSQTTSRYQGVQEQTGINAGRGGYDVQVGGHTQLNGASIASQAAPDKNHLSTDTIGATDIQNQASYSAVSASISFGGGGSSGPSGIGPALPTGLLPNAGVPIHDSKDSTTRSAVSAGAITVRQDLHTGQDSSAAISRDTTTVHQPLARIFNAEKVAEQQELGRVMGEVGNRAIGDLSQKLGLKDGSPEKMALHAALGALQARVSGDSAPVAAATSAGSEWIGTQVQDYLKQDTSLSEPQRKAVQQWAALLTGAAIGGATGADAHAALAGGALALDGERYNRQLHPKEVQWLAGRQKAAARVLSDRLGRAVSEHEALVYLTMAGEGNVDQTNQTLHSRATTPAYSEERQLYVLAKQYLAENAQAGFIDERGQQQRLFAAKDKDFSDSSVYSQYRNDPAYREFYWNTMGDNLRPDNPTPQEEALYQERQAIRWSNSLEDLASGAVSSVMAGTVGAALKRGVRPGTQVVTTGKATDDTAAKPVEPEKIGGSGEKVREEIAALERIKNNPAGPGLVGKSPGMVLSQQDNKRAIQDLQEGRLPGTLPDPKKPWQPREMNATANPNEAAEDFAVRILGRMPTKEERDAGMKMLEKMGGCPGCWIATASDGTQITYRPAGFASGGTLSSTASVDLNNPSTINRLNKNKNGKEKPVKFKFPLTGKTGIRK